MQVKAPRPVQGRARAFGLVFHDGYAHPDQLGDEQAAALRQHGYTIEDSPGFVDLTKLTKPELLDIAATEGVTVPPRATKAQLVDLLSRRPAAPIDDPNVIQEG